MNTYLAESNLIMLIFILIFYLVFSLNFVHNKGLVIHIVYNKKCLHPAAHSGINLTYVGHSQFFQANLSIFERSSWQVM